MLWDLLVSITLAKRNAILAQIDIIDAQLVLANANYSALLSQEVESYKFDSNEGSQQAKRRQLDKIEKSIDRLTIRREVLIQKLNCSGLVNLRLYRRG